MFCLAILHRMKSEDAKLFRRTQYEFIFRNMILHQRWYKRQSWKKYFCRLFHVLGKFSFATAKGGLDSYHQWVNIRVASKHCTKNKMKFSIKDFFSKCGQICIFIRIWSHMLRKIPNTKLYFLCSASCRMTYDLQSFTKYLRLTLVFMWNSELRKDLSRSATRMYHVYK